MKDLTPAYVAIGVSSAALLVSLFTLGWNMYKELGLRPRVKVSLGVMVFPFHAESVRKIRIYAVNFGPGAVYLTGVTMKATWLARLRGGSRFFGIVVEKALPTSDEGKPKKIEIGEQVEFWIPYSEESFLKMKWARVGVTDSFDRNHWAPRKKLRRALAQYEIDFGGKREREGTGSADSGREEVKA